MHVSSVIAETETLMVWILSFKPYCGHQTSLSDKFRVGTSAAVRVFG